MSEGLSADLLIGVNAIAADLGYSRHAAQHLIDRGIILVCRLGSRIHARKSSLAKWRADYEAKAAAEREAVRRSRRGGRGDVHELCASARLDGASSGRCSSSKRARLRG